MKYLFMSICCIILLLLSFPTFATNISLYADSAPNVYGSPNWAPWWNQTKTDVVDGTFVNMRTGTYPGTKYFDPYDEIVYSTGDLGKRLHWIYWIPGKTKESLDKLFEVKWVIDWDGEDWTYDWLSYDLIKDGPDVGWVQPKPNSWENYSGGVIGSFGFAWWATDNEAVLYDNNGNPYDQTNQADIDALRSQVFQYQTYANGLIRYRESVNSEWQYQNLKLEVIPEPSSMMLIGAGLASIAGYSKIRLIRRNKRQ